MEQKIINTVITKKFFLIPIEIVIKKTLIKFKFSFKVYKNHHHLSSEIEVKKINNQEKLTIIIIND